MNKQKYSRVYVEITNICNRNCSFCPGTVRIPKRMTSSEFDLISEKLRSITDYIYLHVMGEPLTHPEVCDFIRRASDKGFKVALTTNGTLLEKRSDELVRSGLYKANISLHSFEKGEEREYIDYILECCKFADLASKNGILTIMRLWNNGCDNGRNINTLEMIKSFFPNDEWKSGSRGIRIRNKLHIEYGDRFEWPDVMAADRGCDVFCHGLGDHFAILCDGTVVPCCLDREGAIPLGNIFLDSPENILSSERAKKMVLGFQNKRAEEELCRKCGYARRFKV